MAPSGYNTYHRTQIATADRRKIVVLLYEGAITRLSQASQAMERGDGDARAMHTNKALDIVHFLSSSLDFEKGGEIATNLQNLYGYIRDTISAANIESDAAKFSEAGRLLTTLLEAWRTISKSTNQTPAAFEERTREVAASVVGAA